MEKYRGLLVEGSVHYGHLNARNWYSLGAVLHRGEASGIIEEKRIDGEVVS
jgi:hypothetical protein